MRGKNQEYPFIVKTDKMVRPEQVDHQRYGPFMRIPGDNHAVWGFRDEDGRSLFYAEYRDHVIE